MTDALLIFLILVCQSLTTYLVIYLHEAPARRRTRDARDWFEANRRRIDDELSHD
jgi:hypothetical protein